MAVRVERKRLATVSERRSDVRDRHASRDLDARPAVPRVMRRVARDPGGLIASTSLADGGSTSARSSRGSFTRESRAGFGSTPA
jgi:hypothetical protein